MTTKTIKTTLFVGLILTLAIPITGFNLASAVIESDIEQKVSLKEKIKTKMNIQEDMDKTEKNSGKKFTATEYGIPYNLIFIKNDKLVVGIDAIKAKEFNKKYDLSDVKRDLQTNQDIEVNYYVFKREANIQGGDAATKGSASSTITLIRSDNRIILTGHLTGVGSNVILGPVGGTGCEMATVQVRPVAARETADAAYATVINPSPSCAHTLVPNTVKYNSNLYTITEGTMSDITVNKFVRMAGIITPTSSGNILDVDVTAKDSQGILDDQVVANYPSAQGDSGAPVISLTGTSTAKILGQHVGKFCLVDLNSGDNFGQWCGSGLTIFSPWPGVKSNLGLS